ncbi:MAG: porin family protein [Bacteroidota bacterium]
MKTFFALVFSFSVFASYAQPGETSSFKRFAFQVGTAVSNMNFNKGEPTPAMHYAAAWKPGITLGFLLRVPLAKNFFLQPEYAYTQRKSADKNSAIDYSLNYFSMPILLNYKIIPAISILAGPQLELLINAKSNDHTGGSFNITHDTEERSIGITAGIEVEIKKIFIFSARYLQGLNHVGIGQRSNVKEFQFQAVNVTAGIRF